jgi:hypothetical protein
MAAFQRAPRYVQQKINSHPVSSSTGRQPAIDKSLASIHPVRHEAPVFGFPVPGQRVVAVQSSSNLTHIEFFVVNVDANHVWAARSIRAGAKDARKAFTATALALAVKP